MEVLVSLVILAVGLLGSLVAVKVAMEATQQNAMRLEAIKIAQEQAEMARNMPFLQVANIPSPQNISRQIRKTQAQFTITTTKVPAGLSNEVTRLTIQVTWLWKGSTHSYSLETMRRQVR